MMRVHDATMALARVSGQHIMHYPATYPANPGGGVTYPGGVDHSMIAQEGWTTVIVPPPGAPPGGVYQEETFIGCTTLIICLLLLFFFWPVTCVPFCCPCDQRVVYIHGGTKYVRSGEIVPMGAECCGYPCGGPAQ
jgi:hypothetical protein